MHCIARRNSTKAHCNWFRVVIAAFIIIRVFSPFTWSFAGIFPGLCILDLVQSLSLVLVVSSCTLSEMTCFPTVLAFSTGSWASIINTMFIPTPETAIEFQFEPGLVCRCYLVPRVILPSICADAICSVKAVDVSGFFFLLTECLLAPWPACAIACICAFVLSSVLARS